MPLVKAYKYKRSRKEAVIKYFLVATRRANRKKP